MLIWQLPASSKHPEPGRDLCCYPELSFRKPGVNQKRPHPPCRGVSQSKVARKASDYEGRDSAESFRCRGLGFTVLGFHCCKVSLFTVQVTLQRCNDVGYGDV